jgi:hypothetical protein
VSWLYHWLAPALTLRGTAPDVRRHLAPTYVANGKAGYTSHFSRFLNRRSALFKLEDSSE